MPADSLNRVPSVVLFGVFEADLRSGELRKNGVRIRIQDLPFRALKLLLSRPNEIVTREEFRQALWPEDVFVDFDLGIRSAIKRLREALGDSAENPIFVETVDRRGYRWIAPAYLSEPASSAVAGPEAVEDSESSTGAGKNILGAQTPDAATQAKRKRLVWLVVIVAVLAIITVIILLRANGPNEQWFGNFRPGVSVAVLPFQNAGSDQDTDFLRLALPDEVVSVLSYVPSLSIRPFATTSRYTGPNLDLQQAGREMRVTAIVTGHYLTIGDQLEVTMEAVDVVNNRSIWRDTITVSARDKIAMRAQITSQVRQGLVPVLGGSSASGEPATRPNSEEAYDLYLRSIAVPHDAAPTKDAIAMLERAVGIDPGYAPAWAALGMRYYYDAIFADGGEPILKRSDEAFQRALSLDPGLVSAAGALITNQADRGNLDAAFAEASALVKRRPDSASAHFVLSYVLRYAGLLDEAARECDTAIKSDPGNYQFRSCSWVFSRLDAPQKAMDFVRLDAGSDWAARQTAFILIGQGKLAEARLSLQTVSHTPLMGHELLQACLDPNQSSHLQESARKVEDAALAGVDAEPRYVFGSLLSYCGQKDAALRLLHSAIQQNYCAYQSLESDPLLIKLRGSPDFSQLLSESKVCQARFLAQREKNQR